MTTFTEHRTRTGEPAIADGLRAVRLTVLAFVLLDVVTSLIGQAYGRTDFGPSGLVPTTQMLLIAGGAAALLWNRLALGTGLAVLVVVLVFVAGPSGLELWLLIVTGVTAGARARPQRLVLVALALTVYAVCFGLAADHRHPGWGWAAGGSMLAVAAASLGAGLAGRRLLGARDRRRQRVRQVERENSQIRAVERARLADELQSLVTGGLASIRAKIDAAARHPTDPDELRRGLDQVDFQSRSLLVELRALLDVLRSDPGDERVGPSVPPTLPWSWVDTLTARHVRIAATAVLVLLAVRAATGSGPSGPAAVVLVAGLVAVAVAIWRPVAGSACAVAALVLSFALGVTTYWDVLPVALLGLVGALREGTRRLLLVVLAVAAYGALLVFTERPDPLTHLMLTAYVAVVGIAIGLAGHHFLEARADSLGRLQVLARQRDQIECEEREAVARELHDVVAAQLSTATMLVMATSASRDCAALTDTLARVGRSTEAAQHELVSLLYAMRGAGADQVRPTSFLTPLASAGAIRRQLEDAGFHPVIDFDPAADALDSTAARTLSRIMQEATTNILRYAPAGSTCRYTLTVDCRLVRLRIVSPLAERQSRSDLSTGWGLRGIRERVELTQGTFSAGPEHGHWVLKVTLLAQPTEPPSGATAVRSGGARLPAGTIAAHPTTA